MGALHSTSLPFKRSKHHSEFTELREDGVKLINTLYERLSERKQNNNELNQNLDSVRNWLSQVETMNLNLIKQLEKSTALVHTLENKEHRGQTIAALRNDLSRSRDEMKRTEFDLTSFRDMRNCEIRTYQEIVRKRDEECTDMMESQKKRFCVTSTQIWKHCDRIRLDLAEQHEENTTMSNRLKMTERKLDALEGEVLALSSKQSSACENTFRLIDVVSNLTEKRNFVESQIDAHYQSYDNIKDWMNTCVGKEDDDILIVNKKLNKQEDRFERLSSTLSEPKSQECNEIALSDWNKKMNAINFEPEIEEQDDSWRMKWKELDAQASMLLRFEKLTQQVDERTNDMRKKIEHEVCAGLKTHQKRESDQGSESVFSPESKKRVSDFELDHIGVDKTISRLASNEKKTCNENKSDTMTKLHSFGQEDQTHTLSY